MTEPDGYVDQDEVDQLLSNGKTVVEVLDGIKERETLSQVEIDALLSAISFEHREENPNAYKNIRVYDFNRPSPTKGEPNTEKNKVTPGLLSSIKVPVSAELATGKQSFWNLQSIGPGTIVLFDTDEGELTTLMADGVPIAYGEVIVCDGKFGLRVVEVL